MSLPVLVEVDVEGLEEALESFQGLGLRILSQVHYGMVEAAMEAQMIARSLAPVRTGRLRSSIYWRTYGKYVGEKVEIGASAPYAGFVEHGTRFMAPRPFLRPAVERAMQSFEAEIMRRLNLVARR
jgi:HK97 gp10 family phage protein